MAGRISEDAIRSIRERASLSEVVSDVVALTRRGTRAVGLCPFHAEKTPSFNVSEQDGFYHCFGCGEGGDVFKFVMDPFDEDVVSFCNLYVAPAQELPLDSQGRILLPPLLREHAGIKRDVTITGDVDKFRIWDRQVWQEVLAEDERRARDVFRRFGR